MNQLLSMINILFFSLRLCQRYVPIPKRTKPRSFNKDRYMLFETPSASTDLGWFTIIMSPNSPIYSGQQRHIALWTLTESIECSISKKVTISSISIRKKLDELAKEWKTVILVSCLMWSSTVGIWGFWAFWNTNLSNRYNSY